MTRLFFTWLKLVHACFYEVVKHSDSGRAVVRATLLILKSGAKLQKKQIKKGNMNVHIKQKLLTLHSNAISEHLFATI